MQDNRHFIELLERTLHKYEQLEKKSCIYGSKNIPLTHVEVHTIATIGDHEHINLTTLANIRGVTKSAASQLIYRLVKKGLVYKQVSPTSDAEINIMLTDAGKDVYKGHKKYHENANNHFFELLKGMPEENSAAAERMLTEFDKALDVWLSEK